jgi:A/G-specific adenine glycosylase
MVLRASNLRQVAPSLRSALLAWFKKHQRRLPWRVKPSAYATVVSELMCQQTQIATVLPYFERWVSKWPDFANLAKAEEAEVLAHWAGLGYYSRAKNLWRLAQEVSALSEVPTTAAGWQDFRGVGPYTAAAIASIAFREPVAVVDGNVIRVLARLLGERQEFRDGAQAMKYFQPLANQLVDPQHPGDFNQAMMELGALVCRKAGPLCDTCPLADFCQSRGKPDLEVIPRFTPKKRQFATVDRLVVLAGSQVLLRRYGATAKRLGGMCELPTAESLQLTLQTEPAQIAKRTIGTVTYVERLHAVKLTPDLKKRIKTDAELEWVEMTELAHASLSGPHRQWLQKWFTRNDPPKPGKLP